MSPSRSRFRSFGILCAAACLLTAGLTQLLGAGTAWSQSSTTLVSNTGQTRDPNAAFPVGDNAGVGSFAAGALVFTTGNDRAYLLSDVEIHVSRQIGSPTLRVSLYDTSSGLPSSSLAVLSNPGSVTNNSINTFAAPDGTTLIGRTTYALVLEVTSRTNGDAVQFSQTVSDAEDTGAASGWSMGNTRYFRPPGGAWASVVIDGRTAIGLFAIKGAALLGSEEVTSATVNGTALTLEFRESLDTASAPAGTAFTVTATPASGSARTIKGTAAAVTISGALVGDNRRVDVTLASAVAAGETVTVAYAKPTGAGAKPLKFAGSGNDVPGFSDQEVTNVTVADVSTPTHTGALVSNTGQGDTTANTLFKPFTRDHAQGFTTGSHGLGYKLTRVNIEIEHSGTPPSYSVSIRSSSTANEPDSDLGTLTLSGSLPANGIAQFNAPSGGIQLAANTNYWVLIDVSTESSTTSVKRTDSRTQDSGAAAGWSISRFGHRRLGLNAEGWASNTSPMKLAIHGTLNSPPPAFSSAEVDRTTLSVTFDKNLKSASVPAGTAFTVTATPEGGTARTIQGTSAAATISGATASVTLASAVARGETVTVAYAKPASNPLQSAAGDVASFTGKPVINQTTGRAGAVPFITRVRIVSYPTFDANDDGKDDTYLQGDGIFVDVDFSEPVEATGRLRLRLDLGTDDTDGDNSRRTLESYQVLYSGRTLRFSYTVVAGDTDADGVWVQTNPSNQVLFTPGDPNNASAIVSALTGASANLVLAGLPTTGDAHHKVDGNKTGGPDVGPRPTGAVVNGDTLTVTFTKNVVSPAKPATGVDPLRYDFQVRGAGGLDAGDRHNSQQPLEVTAAERTLTLKLRVPARAGETVTVSYTGVSLTDASANRMPMFRELAVTNNTPGAAGPEPANASVVVRSLRVAFDGVLDASSLPAGSAFEVETSDLLDDRRDIAGTGTAHVSGNEVIVRLAEAVRGDELATVSYTRPDRNGLRGAGTGQPAVLSFHRFKIGTVDEGEPPTLVGSAASHVTGTTSAVVLWFDEALDGSSEPAVTDFAVTVNGTTASVTVVDVAGNSVALAVDTAVSVGDTVVVTYTPGDNPIRDAAGNNALAFTETLTVARTGKPAFQSASVDGVRVTLAYDTPLHPDELPGPDAFTLHYTLGAGETAADRTEYFTDITAVGVEGQTVVLHLEHPVFPCVGYGRTGHAAFTVSYAKPAAGTLRNLDGTDADGFMHRNVTNARTAQSCEDGIYEARVGSVILRATRPFATDTAPEPGWFTVTASGGPVTVTGAAFSTDDPHELKLTLSRDLAPGETVTASYRRPEGERGLWDVDGRQLADIVDLPVANAARGPARFESAATEEKGRGLILTFTKDILISGLHKSYTVRVDGARRSTRQAFWEDNTVGLVLSEPVRWGETVTVAYAKPSSGTRLHDADELPIESFGPETVENTVPRRPLTASFVDLPAEHDGKKLFRFELRFSEDFPGRFDYKQLRDAALQVTNGRVREAKRVTQGRNDRWTLAVRPASYEDVTLTLPAGAVHTEAGRTLADPVIATVQGPPRLAVADATAREGEDAALEFAVSLNRAASGPVTVDYVTRDGTATAGEDYTFTRGTLTFAPGEVTQTVTVPILDDAHDEGSETFTLTLRNAQGAAIEDGEATGTIKNNDPLQRAWLSRFGRTVGTHVVDAVGERLRGTPDQQSHLTIGGYRVPLRKRAPGTTNGSTSPGPSNPVIPDPRLQTSRTGPIGDPESFSFSKTGKNTDTGFSMTNVENDRRRLKAERGEGGRSGSGQDAGDESSASALLNGLAGLLGLGGTAGNADADTDAPWRNQPGPDPRLNQGRTLDFGQTFNLRQVLLGSSFRLNLGADDPGTAMPRLTAWGRVAGTTFQGMDGNLSLDGDIITGTVGLDATHGRWLGGVAVAHSRGNGTYAMPLADGHSDAGELEQTLTSLQPYLRYAVTDRLDVWGLVGYGWGELEVETAGGATIETDTSLLLGALGGWGLLLAPEDTGGFQVATRTDAMFTRTSSDAAANSAATDADAHRLRLILEGSRGFSGSSGQTFTPTVELGLRHDWGDAETGFGVEVGGRVQYAHPGLGLTVDAMVRGLLAHEDANYDEWGASGTVRLAPGEGGQGLSLTLAPAWGATASGVQGLWTRQTTAGLAPQGPQQAPAGRLAAEVGYGLAFFDTGVITPYAGTMLAAGADRTYRLGTRVQVPGRGAPGLTLNLEGMRQESAGAQPVNQGLRFELSWSF